MVVSKLTAATNKHDVQGGWQRARAGAEAPRPCWTSHKRADTYRSAQLTPLGGKVRRDESVIETLHGAKVADPYRWLEDPDTEETQQFVADQNALTSSVLDECETRQQFNQLLTELFDYPRYSCPRRHGKRYHYSYNTGLQAQGVLYSQVGLQDEGRVLLDPNKLSDDGTVALGQTKFSKDGKLMAYTLSSGGSDWVYIKVLTIDQETGETTDLEDKLEYVKFSSLAWTHDHKGFFYNKFPEPKKGDLGTETDINLNQQLCYHVLGQPQSKDAVVWACPDHPAWMLGAEITDDGRFLLISVTEGTQPTNQLWYVDLHSLPEFSPDQPLDFGPYDLKSGPKPLPVMKLVDTFEASYEYVANDGTVFTFHTNYKAPLYRILRTDVEFPSNPSSWEDIVPEHLKHVLNWAAALKGDVLLVCYVADVASKLQIHSLGTGSKQRDIPLPGIGSVTSFGGRREDSEFFFSFSSFTEPGATYRLDTAVGSAEPKLFRQTKLKGGYAPAHEFETRQVFADSKDGTKVPMFITHKKGTPLDGSAPTLLYGYGGFNINLTPGFSPARLAFMLGYGGILAVANLRGGGEYGLKWHDAGTHGNKQNVFDDFQACAEYLAEKKYTSAGKLIIQGGSNGGLLVAACTNQRPDLFGAVIAQVGVMDMLRFHKFTIGHAWTSDYGNPDEAEDFAYIYPYSPIHNVKPPTSGSQQYPAMIITTGDHDDRVVPLHSHKLTATLQHVLAGYEGSPQRNPLITRIDVRAGHGAGKPTKKVIEEAADSFGFAAKVVGAKWVKD
ncbi:hypothetical protein ABBQ38_008044 [Trebouxia sp. C0009 RCD-2024]